MHDGIINFSFGFFKLQNMILDTQTCQRTFFICLMSPGLDSTLEENSFLSISKGFFFPLLIPWKLVYCRDLTVTSQVPY